MAVDRSFTRRGWIYIVYAERDVSRPDSTPDIFLIRSADSGKTWFAPRKVNQDNTGRDQWSPWIAVDPNTGFLYVVYYDSRNFPNNDSAQVFISWSTNGGDSFGESLVSDTAFLPAAIPGAPDGYMGDYIGIAAKNNIVWPCWNDNRTGIHQAYTVRLDFTPQGDPCGESFDMNKDGTLDVTDVVLLQNCVYEGKGDNCDGSYTPSDVVNLMNFVFMDIPLPC
jgi:hypothetical protein